MEGGSILNYLILCLVLGSGKNLVGKTVLYSNTCGLINK